VRFSISFLLQEAGISDREGEVTQFGILNVECVISDERENMRIKKTALALSLTFALVGCAVTPKITLNTGDMVMEVTSKAPLVSAVAYAPDGKSVVSGGWDAIARHWDLDGAREVRKYGSSHEGFIEAIAFSPDGRTVAVSDTGVTNFSNNKLTLWDTATGNVYGRFPLWVGGGYPSLLTANSY